ncbi:MAG: divergent PAP2 family protein, partial [Ruminococcaceae bacterium]|nr:divergent PAP2 family protein [Oscillospiraceae bacterium]
MDFKEYLAASLFVTALLGWFIAQALKVVFILIKYKRLDFSRFIGSGGMPSSHSSLVTSLATGVGLIEGFDSTLFTISIVLALIVMYDAAGVRRAAGQQAKILNKIVDTWGKEDYKLTE